MKPEVLPARGVRSSRALTVLLLACIFALSVPDARSPRSRAGAHLSLSLPPATTTSAATLAPSAITPLTYNRPHSWKLWRHADGYDTWLFVDLFLKGDTVHLVATAYVRMIVPHDRVRVSVPALGIAPRPVDSWLVRNEYESVVLGFFSDARLASAREATVVVEFLSEARDYRLPQLDLLNSAGVFESRRAGTAGINIAQHPPSAALRNSTSPTRASRFGMCALFHTDAHLLEAWSSYWWLLGVEHFYLHYNGPEEDIPALQARAALLRPTFHFTHWPFDYWVPDVNRPHHGQPLALNDCFYRNRDRHNFLLMYDLDELLVFSKHADLHSFFDWLAPQGPFAAVRTQSAWAKVELDALGTSAERITIDHIAALPLTRSNVDYSREKYAVNTSRIAGVSLVNVHGVYEVETAPRPTTPEAARADGFSQLLLDEAIAFHFHFVNVGRDRSRERLLRKHIKDPRAMEMVKEGLKRKGRPEKARMVEGMGKPGG